MTRDDSLPTDRRLRQEILFARERVYHFGQPTPLEKLPLTGNMEIWVKREDLSPIKAYKWRGAANRMATLSELEAARGVVTASAGNHAQGVALAAKKLGIRARVYMPRSTPKVKQDAVLTHGAEYVSIHLAGDSYDEAVQAAKADQAQTQAVYIHAYDDLQVMAGQGTLADEIVLSGNGPFDVAYLQIGGGGMAAGVSTWLKTYWPDIEIVGVEGEGQASMKAAIKAGKPVALPQVDLFCDGTAVKQAGELPFEICKQTLDRIVTVTNAEVTSAIRKLWEGLRCISEPSGAMGLAAALGEKEQLAGKKALVVLCGANVDFLQLGRIAQSEGSSTRNSRTLRVRIPEEPGTMLSLLDNCFSGTDITDFQYGKTDNSQAWPCFTLSSENPADLASVPEKLDATGLAWEDITGATDIAFRAIPLRGDLLAHPAFLRLDFYERPGALHDFLAKRVSGNANLVYFNYRQSGERIGRALIGLDFPSPFERDAFLLSLPPQGDGYRLCEPLDAAASSRLAAP
ncbi:MAG: pyridoxal-phosphate dependent enzyme [Akkermansiaceae bacterium]|jgi:threonine dehydratase|nr:pyridoxal-phosphate dependent enzyme [Akkermansiaceae bacterium]MDP4647899.1 pyridoxal-phosphate dependent enzyme [Akkermansiaceae bacterium]MDP4719689.1 pyridoxal-phosphate dependent enzyme [Akkermansiaceae bacterium]MDP4779755.1 pyridoxal-phosphate dependent enzyme [Akkermansiaceae bacterium]MDP4846000.1 pyridoxal-phosphate dependent enzyme [Akkermansiaceae bacterium]